MNIRSTLYIFMLLTSLNALAQKTEIEILAGPDLVSLVRENSSTNRKTRISTAAGLGVNHYFSAHWSIGLKALYERKGSKSGGTFPANFIPGQTQELKYEAKNNLDYLAFPFMAGYTFGSHIHWTAEFGPYIGFLLNAKQHSSIKGYPDTNTTQTSNYKSEDVGIAAAVSMTLPLTKKISAKAAIMESFGLMDINNFPPNQFFDTSGTIKTNSLNLRLGITCLLGATAKP